MRLAIIGQQAFGKSVLEAFIKRGDLVAGVFCAPATDGGQTDPLLQATQQLGLPLFQMPSLRSKAAVRALDSLDVDLAVMAYALQFVSQEFALVPRHGAIAFHPSLLPAHRGPSSINWAIISGEKQTGLTIFRPTDGVDEGPIVLQKRVEIRETDTVGSVYFEKLFPQGVRALTEVADLIVSGVHSEVAQDESLASYEGWCRDPEARVNWCAPLGVIHDLVRGCNPAPGAWTLIRGHKVRLYDAVKHPSRRFADVSGRPGEICNIGRESLTVAAPGGRLEIFKMRLDGAAKAGAASLAAQLALRPGCLLFDANDNELHVKRHLQDDTAAKAMG